MSMLSNRLSVLLLLLCSLLGSLIYFETQPGTAVQSVPAKAPGIPAQGAGARPPAAGLTIPALAALTETVDRPFFSANRRPAPVPDDSVQIVEAAPSVATDPISLSLSAVIINGAQRMALLQGPDPGAELFRAEEGQSVEGWLVEEVLPGRIVLRRGEEQQELLLRKFQPPPQALLPAAAPGKPKAEADEDETLTEALDLRRPRRPLRGPRLRSQKRNSRE